MKRKWNGEVVVMIMITRANAKMLTQKRKRRKEGAKTRRLREE
jgi:hypothetical protein